MTFENAIYFLLTLCYTFHNPIQSHHGHPLQHTQSHRHLLIVLLSISRSPRGAHVLANPNRHERSFVGRSQLFVHFVTRFACWRRRTTANGPPSRCPLEHTKTTKKCRSPSSETDRDARRNFAEFMFVRA